MAKQINSSPPTRFSIIFRHLRQYRGYLYLGALVTVLSNVLALITPYLIKVVYDMLEQSRPVNEIVPYLLLMIGLALGAGFFRFMMRRTIIWMSRKLEYALRGDLVNHLLTLSPRYYDNTRTGDIMSRVTNDLEAVRMMIGPGIMQGTNTLVTVLTAITFMIILSPKLTVYSLIPALVLPFVVNRLGTLSHKMYLKIQEHFAALTATAQENLAGVRVIKAYRQEEPEIEHFSEMSQKYVHLNMDMGRLMATFYPLIGFVAGGLVLAVLYWGGIAVIDNELTLGSLVAFFVYLNMLLWPIMAVGWVVSLYQRGTASLSRLNEILNTPPEIYNESPNLHRGPMRGKIEFRKLSFAYADRVILDSISLTVEPSQTIGIIGLTGSGKSTLLSLLGRLYPVSRDQIFIDTVDINDWDVSSLRAQIGYATQEPFLFSDTIAENIRFGKDYAPLSEVRSAADIAALSRDVESFPHGFETMVGERGITLSGGQKQRTAIARAMLIDPAILILDDATSSVDTETEHTINEAIHGRPQPCTTFVVSHRVSSVKEADLIICLSAGKISEQGNHDQLLKYNGYYARLYRAQLMAQELEAY